MPHDMVVVVVNSPADYETRRVFYEKQGFRVTPARKYRTIKIDLQDYNATEAIIKNYRIFYAEKSE